MSHHPPQDPLHLGRQAADDWRWAEAFELLHRAAEDHPLDGEDLERLAFSAHLVGREDDYDAAMERAHEAFLAGNTPRAARSAIWLTLAMMDRGDMARGGGWLARARRLLESHDGDCVERGYVLLPAALQLLGSGDGEAALAAFGDALSIGERFGETDLVTLGRLGVGQALVEGGQVDAGTALFDEVMVTVTTGGVSPTIAGIVYCAVIETCYGVFDIRRAHEWTTALRAWCDEHPDLVPFRGQCLTYRAEVMRLQGAWPDALEEARRAEALLTQPFVHPAAGASLYEQAELHRLRGEFRLAEEGYRKASRWGRHPEPGLALLRLAQGRVAPAAAAMRRGLAEARDTPTRSRLLPAFVEVMLAAGDLEAARDAARELTEIASRFDVAFLRAASAQAEGHVLLVEGNPQAAVAALRRAWSEWQELHAPYEAARVRVLIARACEALGDDDSAEMERDAARWAFERLGASADLATIEAASAPSPDIAGGLTPRELEVLRLVATGRTNRQIATDLVISEKTVARHVSNILAKAEVSSRTGAVAYAHDRGLL